MHIAKLGAQNLLKIGLKKKKKEIENTVNTETLHKLF